MYVNDMHDVMSVTVSSYTINWEKLQQSYYKWSIVSHWSNTIISMLSPKELTLSTWKIKSSSQTFSKHLSSVSTKTWKWTKTIKTVQISTNETCKQHMRVISLSPGSNLKFLARFLKSRHKTQNKEWRSVCRSACSPILRSTWGDENK